MGTSLKMSTGNDEVGHKAEILGCKRVNFWELSSFVPHEYREGLLGYHITVLNCCLTTKNRT